MTLVAVTKTHTAADVRTLAALGVFDVGESRDQEARGKILQLTDVMGLRWHFVGRLQRKKAKTVAGYAHAVHSVDRPELIPLLAAGVDAAGRPPLEVFVQVSLDGDPERGGAHPDTVQALADAVAQTPELILKGLMAVAPTSVEPDAAFAQLAELAADIRERHPEATSLSAGMSHDMEAAIRNGATHLRIGTALLGRRPDVLG